MRVRQSILEVVGDTPLLKLGKLFAKAPFHVYAKLEALNPGGSMKDRPALAMIREGLASGTVTRDSVIVESSSGNMGIGLAQACRYFNLRFICVVDPRTTELNMSMLRAYGAEVDMVREPDQASGEFLQARITRVKELLSTTAGSTWVDQYSNPANIRSHYQSTIREILDALDGELDYLFCAVSTCGTLGGCASMLREIGHPARVIAVDAVGSAIFASAKAKRPIPGLGAGIVPPLLDPTLVHEHVHVTPADCVVGCRKLVREEAVLAGGSAGGLITAIEMMSGRIPRGAPPRTALPRGARCVAVLPDRGERYLDTIYNDDWVREHCGDMLLGGVPAPLFPYEEVKCTATA
jgi:cysteine synthase A